MDYLRTKITETFRQKAPPRERSIGLTNPAACGAALFAVFVTALAPGVAAKEDSKLVEVIGILPPEISYADVCARTSVRVPLITDWARWDGSASSRETGDLLKIAREYSKGSERVFADPATAERILEFVEANRKDIEFDELRLAQAENLLNAQQNAFSQEAMDGLRRAIDAGSIRAATLLARYLGPEAPPNRQNLKEAARLYAVAARAGNLEAEQGLIALANNGNPEFAMEPDEKRLHLTNVLNRMIHEIVAKGTCSYLSQIGNIYLLEKYIHKQNDVALAWLKVQAELGDGVLAELLGRRLKLGRFFDYNLEKSIELFKIAADKGRPRAMLEVGQAHIKSLIGNPSERLGEKYLLLAAEAELPKAYEVLAKYYRGSYGHRFQPDLAVEYYEKAAAAGEKQEDMLFGLGKLLMLDTPQYNPKRALEAFETAADLGHEGAAREAANLYMQNLVEGSEADYVKAVRLYRFAAISGDSAAARALSMLYRCGEGLPYRYEASETWMDKAAFLGSSESMYELSQQVLREGLSEKDEVKTARGLMLLRRAAHDGSAKAVAALAHAYEQGAGYVDQDAERYGQLMAYSARNPYDHPKILRELAVRRFDANMSEIERRDVIERTAAQLNLANLDPAFVQAFAAEGTAGNPAAELFGQAQTLLEAEQDDYTVDRAMELLSRAAGEGYVKAKIDLARFSAEGYTVDGLDEIGREGVCSVRDALALAAAFAEVGTGTASQLADQWLTRAEEIAGSDPVSVFDVAQAYWKGAFGDLRRPRAEAFLLNSLNKGQEQALLILAEGHVKEVWTNADPERGAALLRDVSGPLRLEASYQLLRYISQGRVKSQSQEVEQLLALVRSDPDLRSELAPIYLKLADLAAKDAFGSADGTLAVSWLEEAAEKSADPLLFRRVSDIYLNGQLGMKRDLEQGMHWMLKAAEAGDAIAAQRVARSYEFGFVFEKNASLAAEWDEKARILQ